MEKKPIKQEELLKPIIEMMWTAENLEEIMPNGQLGQIECNMPTPREECAIAHAVGGFRGCGN